MKTKNEGHMLFYTTKVCTCALWFVLLIPLFLSTLLSNDYYQ